MSRDVRCLAQDGWTGSDGSPPLRFAIGHDYNPLHLTNDWMTTQRSGCINFMLDCLSTLLYTLLPRCPYVPVHPSSTSAALSPKYCEDARQLQSCIVLPPRHSVQSDLRLY